jgi:phosphoglucosamine mutase
VKAAIAEAELRLGTSGRLLIRKSGTESLIRVMGESEDERLLGSVIGEICSVIGQAAH